MSACRESRPMERALDRFMNKIRSVDKVLWSYSGKNIEKEEYPLSSFLWIEEELDEAHTLWMALMDEKRNERDKVVKLNNEKHPKKNAPEKYPVGVSEVSLIKNMMESIEKGTS